MHFSTKEAKCLHNNMRSLPFSTNLSYGNTPTWRKSIDPTDQKKQTNDHRCTRLQSHTKTHTTNTPSLKCAW